MVLWQVHDVHPTIPLDPELFVASQPHSDDIVNPWSILADAEAGNRYRRRVRKIVRLLRDELRREIRRVEREVREGASPSSVLFTQDPRLSPLGRYISAFRLGRPDLAGRLETAAAQQHTRCPLYRWACLPLLAAENYPSEKLEPCPRRHDIHVAPRKVASLN